MIPLHGLWWSRPAPRAVRHLASLVRSSVSRDPATEIVIYRTACGKDIVRRPGDPHPADSVREHDRRPCLFCLASVRNRIDYLAEILEENESLR